MNINISRKIDRYVGPKICRFLLFLNWLKVPAAKSNNITECNIKNILILKFFGIGTILLASPALMKLKKKYPFADITILTLSANRQICEALPSINNVICLSLDRPINLLINYLKILLDIRKKKFDVAIDLEFLTNFSAMTILLIRLFTNLNVAIGFLSPIKWRNKAYNINVSFDHSRHITKIFLKVVSSLCGNDNNFDLSFDPEKTALLKKADDKFFETLLITNKTISQCDYFICVNINTGVLSLNRRWPEEHFMVLVKELIKEPRAAIFLIGGKEDIDYVYDFYKKIASYPRVINLCGKTTISQLIGLLAKTNLLITNDSGPLHLAYVLGTSTISFFGPETPYLYGPIGDNHFIFYEDSFCSPCINIYNSKFSHCKDNFCLRNITPERVLKVVREKYLKSTAKNYSQFINFERLNITNNFNKINPT